MQNKVFDRSNLKGLSPDLQDEIIRRFNDYDTLTRVMKLAASNLITTINTTTGMNTVDKADIIHISKMLKNATSQEWLKENSLFY